MTVIRVCYQICLNNPLSKVVQSMTSTFHSVIQKVLSDVIAKRPGIFSDSFSCGWIRMLSRIGCQKVWSDQILLNERSSNALIVNKR